MYLIADAFNGVVGGSERGDKITPDLFSAADLLGLAAKTVVFFKIVKRSRRSENRRVKGLREDFQPADVVRVVVGDEHRANRFGRDIVLSERADKLFAARARVN